ncbi:MAG: 7-carboxy-7-deazaguanine synthase QueE [Candidatus Omnitrophota bacterium]
MKAKISEVFKSIQGEGPYQGTTQIFVRFFGCNLGCTFCDTEFISYEEKNLKELLGEIAALGECGAVSLTGGEPLLQLDFLKKLSKRLKEQGRMVYLETNGTLYQNLEKIIGNIDIIAMDFKLPSSTMCRDLWLVHKEFLRIALQKEVFIKAVITSTTEISDIFKCIDLIKTVGVGLVSARNDTQFILQPQNPFEDLLRDKLQKFQNICVKRGVNTKIMSQLHKELGLR